MPTIRLATDDVMRAITSQNLDQLNALPHLYILASHLDWNAPQEGEAPDVRRTWDLAKGHGDGSVFIYERLYPDAVVAQRNVGQRVSRADLVYHGAEPVVDFAPQPSATV